MAHLNLELSDYLGFLMRSILVVDDEALMRAFLRQALGKAGYCVTEARNGRDGLTRLKEISPDLVITDIIMDEKDGLELLLELRRMRRGMKVIAMSGGGSSGALNFLDVAQLLGATTLQKPISKDVLLATVQRELSPTHAAIGPEKREG